MKAAIIGNGTVGKALGKAMGITPYGPGDEPISADVVVICVPTETKEGVHDQSQVEQAISRVENAKIIVLRSTVLPGTSDRLAKDLDIPLVFVPEYGFEATMEEDLAHPRSLILGVGEGVTLELVDLVITTMPRSNSVKSMSRASAEFAKYFANIWGCSQVTLANSLYDWVIAQGYDDLVYRDAVLGALLHGNVPEWGWEITHQGTRGYGGKCLPKDIQAAISQYSHELWRQFEIQNRELRKEVIDNDLT